MKGRAWLFSAAIAVLTRPLLAEGAKADADPIRREAIAANFIFLRVWYKIGRWIGCNYIPSYCFVLAH